MSEQTMGFAPAKSPYRAATTTQAERMKGHATSCREQKSHPFESYLRR